MNRQWLSVLVIVAGIGLGATALVKYAPVPEGAQVGNRAPDFDAVNLLTGDSVTFRDAYEGHLTLVNIWATWCAPCRAEMPAMEELYQAFKDQGFRIAAVSVDEAGPADVMAFARELNLTFDILHDRRGQIQQRYFTTGVPESFLIDGEGIIVRKQIGEHPWSSPANRRILEQLLGQKGTSIPVPDEAPVASEPELKPSGG